MGRESISESNSEMDDVRKDILYNGVLVLHLSIVCINA